MLLIIPSIEIENGKCARMVQGTGGFVYSDDPVEIAKLWRKENAKSLHVTDRDGITSGCLKNFETIRSMVKTVDIPIELGGGIRKFEDAKMAFDNGIYRIVIGKMLLENSDDAKKTLDTYGPSKVVFGIDAQFVESAAKINPLYNGLTPLSIALSAKQIGFRRFVYTDIVVRETNRTPNFISIKNMAEQIQSRITVSGGISNLDDLMKIQAYEPLGVDSVVIGRALYENKFSCQKLWRVCEAENYPYTAKV